MLNKNFSDSENFDRRCNELEKWLMVGGCNKKMIRKQILNANKHYRSYLYEKEKQRMSEK